MKLSLASLSSLASLALLGQTAVALSPAQWREQSIYFLMTDRFARTDGSTTATCDPNYGLYCGGSWQGIINKVSLRVNFPRLFFFFQSLTLVSLSLFPPQLDYIQGMGFTAIWITPITGQFYEVTADGSSYHGYWQQNM